jgi:capsular polysaccharide biosynthesis protein
MIVLAIVFYALGYYLTMRSKSVSYCSYTELYIHTISSSVEDYTKYITAEAQYVDTYLLTIDTYKFYEELRQQLPEHWRDKVTAGELKSCVSPAKRSESAIIRFSVYTYDSELTYEITKTLSLYMDDYFLNNYRVNSVQVVEEPRPSAPSVSQNRNLSLILAAVGVILAFVIGYMKELFDKRIRSVADVENNGIPVLGVIPDFSGSSKHGGKTPKHNYAKYAEASASNSDKNEKNK